MRQCESSGDAEKLSRGSGRGPSHMFVCTMTRRALARWPWVKGLGQCGSRSAALSRAPSRTLRRRGLVKLVLAGATPEARRSHGWPTSTSCSSRQTR